MNINEPNEVQPSNRRYLRVDGVEQIYGIRRSTLYAKAKAGKIKSITLREEGTSRGTRLFCVESIENYINSFA